MSFNVDLDTYRGPLDLLLYLVRKHEVDIIDIPIASITEQFLDHLEMLEQLDIDSVGDFLEMASTLIEIKSRMVLPHDGEEVEAWDDPREELVQRLLQYKNYNDAASMLDEQSQAWQQHYPRLSDDLPPRPVQLDEQSIQSVELWDLVSAFGRIIRERNTIQPSTIVYDETPVSVYMMRIHSLLVKNRRVGLWELIEPKMHKSSMIGVFLAILELVRHCDVHTEQKGMYGEIWLLRGENFQESAEKQQTFSFLKKGSLK